MIVDRFENIELFKPLSVDIYSGLKFLSEAKADIIIGEYDLSSNVKAIVSEYNTIAHFERGFEAHKHCIDIQYPVTGLERIKWSPINGMSINIEYDEIKDRTFYKNPSSQSIHVDIGNSIFAIMFPNDGHSPQHYIKEPEFIKKITIKVKI